MSNSTTWKMLRAFRKDARVPKGYYTSMFQAPRDNFYNSEKVKIDITRDDEDVAIAVTDMSTGSNMNAADLYTNKEFLPPVFNEGFVINTWNLIKRRPGQDPFSDPGYQAAAFAEFKDGAWKVAKKIWRALELQCSQVMQTGVVDLKDAAGVTRYTIDYKPKSTHFPTVTAATWGEEGATIMDDIEGLANVIRNDSHEDPKILDFGSIAWNRAINDAAFKANFETRRADVGSIVPMEERRNGAQYRGTLDVGTYKFDMYTYNDRYKDPESGDMLQYMSPTKVGMRVPEARLDLTYGNIPMVTPMSQRVMPFIPSRVMSSGFGGMDMILNVWTNQEGTQVFGSVSARPLAIPTDIDSFGAIETTKAA